MANGSNGMNHYNRQDLYIRPLVQGIQIPEEGIPKNQGDSELPLLTNEDTLTWIVKKSAPMPPTNPAP